MYTLHNTLISTIFYYHTFNNTLNLHREKYTVIFSVALTLQFPMFQMEMWSVFEGQGMNIFLTITN